MRTTLKDWFRRARHTLQAIAPYLTLILLPGGSLIFVAVMASRHRQTTKVHL